MLKDIITRYTENINALRDFVNSIQARLDEHMASSLAKTEPMITDRVDQLRKTFAQLPKEETEALASGNRGDLKAELSKDLGFPFDVVRLPNQPDGRVGFHLTFDVTQTTDETREVLETAKKHKDLLYRSSLITLISTVELCLSELLHFYFGRFPDAVGSREKTFSLEDLKLFASIEEAKQHLVESKVENLLRGSLDDWFKFLREQVRLSMGYLENAEPELVEIAQRRNLLVHNGGRANSIYLSKVPQQLRENVAAGDLLKVEPAYLNAALDQFELVFILIGAELWKKLDSKDNDRAETLISITFHHLLNERWKISEGLSYFVIKDKQISEKNQLYGQLNYWQSLKWQGRYDAVKTEVEQADFTAKDPLYQLALLSLMDRTDEFFSLLPKVLQSGGLSRDDLATWPIFRNMRTHDKYQSFMSSGA